MQQCFAKVHGTTRRFGDDEQGSLRVSGFATWFSDDANGICRHLGVQQCLVMAQRVSASVWYYSNGAKRLRASSATATAKRD